jgi:hypothetical protein
MSPAQAVREVLEAAVAVTAIVTTRIYPARAPDRAPAPFVVVTGVSEVPQATFEASTAATLRESRVQVDCYHKQHDQAHALAEAAEDALEAEASADGLRAFKIDSRDSFEDDTQLHRVQMDFSIWRGR